MLITLFHLLMPLDVSLLPNSVIFMRHAVPLAEVFQHVSKFYHYQNCVFILGTKEYYSEDRLPPSMTTVNIT
jgi:hypothetical protein